MATPPIAGCHIIVRAGKALNRRRSASRPSQNASDATPPITPSAAYASSSPGWTS